MLRVGFAILLSQSMFWWAGQLLRLLNQLAAAVVSVPLDLSATAIPGAIELAILLIVALYFGVRAWIKGALGTIFLAALLAVGPFALLFFGLRQTERWGKWWVGHLVPWAARPGHRRPRRRCGVHDP